LGSGLEERAVAGGEGGEHAAGGNGEREIPGRGDDDDSQWVHLAASEIGRYLFERARIVAGEVDGLRDLRVGLGHRLGAVDDHGADEVGATAGEDECGLVEEGAALRGRTDQSVSGSLEKASWAGSPCSSREVCPLTLPSPPVGERDSFRPPRGERDSRARFWCWRGASEISSTRSKAARKRSRSRSQSGEPGSRPKTWRRKLSGAVFSSRRRTR